MYGIQCVGVELNCEGDLWTLALNFGLAGHQVPLPKTDWMGLGIIAYWPRFEIQERVLDL